MPSNSPQYPPNSNNSSQSAIAEGQTANGKSAPKGQPPSSATESKQPWLIALGVALLLGLGYGGWRWWQKSAGSPEQAAQAQAQAVPVELETVQTSTVLETSEFIGSLTSPLSATISPEIQGRVSRLYVDEGSEVQAGDSLIQLSPDRQSAELASLQAAVDAAQSARANALAQLQSVQSERGVAAAEVELQNEQYRRRQFLVEEGALAREELDLVERDRRTATAELRAIEDRIQAARASLNQAEADVREAQADVAAAREQLQDTTLTAPFAGEVGNISIKLGEYVSPGDALTSVTQNDPLELELAVPVERRSDLRTGLSVELSDMQGNPLGSGQITFVSPQVSSNSQTILAQARFPNSDGQLRDEQDVRAQIVWDERSGVLVPTVAVTRVGGQAFVYVAQETPEGEAQLVAQQVPVEVGEVQNNSYPVLAGVAAGDRLIVTGILKLSDGTPIQPQSQPQDAEVANP
ncbi:MAG: efflux RND transporter periplasmic adaptor subunit [Cyanophyceae cyanobacterium]